MIALVRVDNRLIHGQVVSTWIPHLKVDKVVVVDDDAAASPLIQAAMTMALPPHLEAEIVPRAQADLPALARSSKRILVLVRDVANAEAVVGQTPIAVLNLGNVHFGEGRKAISASVFLAEDEVEALGRIAAGGTEIEARAVPTDHRVGLEELRARYRAAS
ncbi:PTS system mannose/fructose/N-acetylgalactosamine-transporter subunit IIB [Vulgatibacter sp.]|uniref:PTS system mannose/fructose/N-acetylgalactosamine-transporter subunit IIB n=1 Tax=Vulgatibacter sp. TaxID=1971226 RepID=UPI003569595C